MKIEKTLLAVSIALALTACGGGGGGGGSSNNGPVEPPVAQPRTLSIENMAWLQIVQQDMEDDATQLASNKETRVRIDVLSERDNEVLPTNAQLSLCSAPTTCESFALVPNSINAPRVINDAALTNSYVAVIPANKLTSDVTSYRVHVDTNSPAEATNPLFKTGDVSVKDIRAETIVVRQVSFRGQTGAFPSNANIKSLLERTYPQSDLAISGAPTVVPASLREEDAVSVENGVYTFPLSVLDEFMNEMDMDYCRKDNIGALCFTAWPDNVKFIFGETDGFIVGGYANGLNVILNQSFTATDDLSVTTPYGGEWLAQSATILVHEFGHMMNLGHAACNVEPSDENVGYPDGRIGANGGGYDAERGFYFTTAGGQFSDFMSYCAKNWSSDINYRQIISTQRTDSDNSVGRTDSDNSVGRSTARLIGSSEHNHDHATTGTQQQYLGFYRRNGAWTMKLVNVDPAKLKPFNGLQKAGALHPALAGLPLQSVQTHFGQPETGPFFVPVTNRLKGLIPEGRLTK